MATSTYLTNPTVNLAPTTGGAKVDLTDQCRSATVTLGVDSLESTAFGDSGHRFVAGSGPALLLQSRRVLHLPLQSHGRHHRDGKELHA